ncbi:MAG: hypothetical protein HC898_05330 [Phycisphaerales bacterium]|nr:hypothetical protein [Phycisphaerales bacterium]
MKQQQHPHPPANLRANKPVRLSCATIKSKDAHFLRMIAYVLTVLILIVAGVIPQVLANRISPGQTGTELPGATLPTSADHETLLRKASELIGEKKYREGIGLLGHLLETTRGELVSPDGRHYQPITGQVLSLLAQLPAEGLEEYRLLVDGPAGGALGRTRSQIQSGTSDPNNRAIFFQQHRSRGRLPTGRFETRSGRFRRSFTPAQTSGGIKAHPCESAGGNLAEVGTVRSPDGGTLCSAGSLGADAKPARCRPA